MIRYLDSSALVKRYVLEPGSDELADLFADPAPVATSRVTLVEVAAALARRAREGALTSERCAALLADLRADLAHAALVAVDDDVLDRAGELCSRYALRTLDALHLASALEVRNHLGPDVAFVCADRRLLAAAGETGLATHPLG
jgi:predicted nucleic acid-binding protein